ncbi:aminotransferase class V-fold PLP-dependent enzyme [Candidatus Aminicenantes bacterium AC-334-K16]|jgi:aromatic-L-amino-acid decarboxylase|nr:aminotransferase class V-fold PLP-dependent enzyme [Candidatus Aminicenantes bacterium AC-334-K16]
MNQEEFKRFGYLFVDWVVDYLSRVGDYPVCSPLQPGEIKNKIPHSPPEEGESITEIFHDFEKIILPGMTHWQHPGWFAYFPANNSPPSILAELLTAGLGAQCMIWKTSPAATELEEVVCGWLRQMLGLPSGLAGVIQDTASTSTLVALLTAREKATDYQANLKGIKLPLCVYASQEAHSSVEKGVKIAGYGREALRYIPADENYALIPEALEEAINQDKAEGYQPACVVATLGTTSSGAVDPLAPIGRICQKHGLWLHVDAAYAGTAAILPEKRWILEGMEHVDSFVFNPHKWMLTNFDCSVYFIKDKEALIRTFEIHPEYLKTGVDAVVNNYRDWGIQLGRRFRALKLWFVLRYYGVSGLQAIIRKHIRLAQMFKEWLEDDERFEILAPVHFSLVCFRLNDGRSEAELNELNRSFHQKINKSGRIFLTHTSLRGKYTIRLVVGSRTTEEEHVREAWAIIRQAADEVTK